MRCYAVAEWAKYRIFAVRVISTTTTAMSNDDIIRLYDLFLLCEGVTTDSRNIVGGELFVALKGEHFDGNRFAEEALQKGARYAVVSDEAVARASDRCYYVADTTEALGRLAYHHRSRCAIPLLLITGTNGKTTTKELVAAVLAQKYKVHYTTGNLNNHIGLPLTLLQLRPEHEIAVVEAGASHRGEIDYLAKIADPDYGIITNIGRAHLEAFGSYQGVIDTKTELYDYLLHRSGTAFVCADDALLMRLSAPVNRLLYGAATVSSGEKLLACGHLSLSSQLATLTVDLLTPREMTIATHLVGGYNLPNVLAAVAVGLHFGVALEDIAKALRAYMPDNHRSQLIGPTARGNLLVADVYNANPSSMQEAVQNILHTPSKQGKLLLLGDMLELGVQSEEEHRKVVDMLVESQALYEKVMFAGPQFYALRGAYTELKPLAFYSDKTSLQQHLQEEPITGKMLLLKASHGMHFETLIENL